MDLDGCTIASAGGKNPVAGIIGTSDGMIIGCGSSGTAVSRDISSLGEILYIIVDTAYKAFLTGPASPLIYHKIKGIILAM